jgi:hypothetical protein
MPLSWLVSLVVFGIVMSLVIIAVFVLLQYLLIRLKSALRK